MKLAIVLATSPPPAARDLHWGLRLSKPKNTGPDTGRGRSSKENHTMVPNSRWQRLALQHKVYTTSVSVHSTMKRLVTAGSTTGVRVRSRAPSRIWGSSRHLDTPETWALKGRDWREKRNTKQKQQAQLCNINKRLDRIYKEINRTQNTQPAPHGTYKIQYRTLKMPQKYLE
jgi:hypothetical protein